MNLLPIDSDGQELTDDNSIFDDFIDDPNDLIGKTIHFWIEIGEVALENTEYKDLFIEYSLKLFLEDSEKEDIFVTEKINGLSKRDNFNYKKSFQYDEFSGDIKNYLMKSNMRI